VHLLDSLLQRRLVRASEGSLALTRNGEVFMAEFGIDLATLTQSRRPLCRTCLDWSERRPHLAGSLGAALLQRLATLGWARRENSSRAVAFSSAGQRQFERRFPLK